MTAARTSAIPSDFRLRSRMSLGYGTQWVAFGTAQSGRVEPLGQVFHFTEERHTREGISSPGWYYCINTARKADGPFRTKAEAIGKMFEHRQRPQGEW